MKQPPTKVTRPLTPIDRAPWQPYCVPAVTMFIAASVAPWFPRASYPIVYSLELVIVTALLVWYRRVFHQLKWTLKGTVAGILVGLLVFAFWIPLDQLTPVHLSGSREAYNPFAAIPQAGIRDLFILVRFTGLALVAPVAEELFWRSFLVRYVAKPDGDFSQVDITRVRWTTIVGAAGLFALAHPEWLSAWLCGVLYTVTWRRAGNLSAAITAHVVTNLALGLWIMHTHQWKYW